MYIESVEAKPIYVARVRAFIRFSLVVGLFFGLVSLISFKSERSQIIETITVEEQKTNPLSIKVSNKYNEHYGNPGLEYPWIDVPIVEPYRDTILTVQGLSNKFNDQSTIIQWIISESNEIFEGQSITYQFEKVSTYLITVQQIHRETKQIISSGTQEVVCKYVRREIRRLYDADRRAFFDALEVVYTLPTSEGRAIYGPKYSNINDIASFHSNLVGDSFCDHLNDGYGFLVSHASLTLMFEQVLQSVNPQLTVPYWDFTIDGHDYLFSGKSMDIWENSIIFHDEWFGESSPEHKILTQGRFAYTEIQGNLHNTTNIKNAYGYMRSPWNQNKIPYVTRSSEMFGFSRVDVTKCVDHYNLLSQDQYTDFVSTSIALTKKINFGGAWNADWKSYLSKWSYNTTKALEWVQIGVAKQKDMFRKNLLRCPSYCSPDTRVEDCKCVCAGYDDMIENKEFPEKILNYFFSDKSQYEGYEGEILSLLCNAHDDVAPIFGDHFESSSPLDVLFWPLQPTMDRLLQWKRINGFKDMTWPNHVSLSGNGKRNGYCYGHNLNDITFFRNLFDDSNIFYSNEDILQLLDPNVNTSPYIYDNFQWKHCQQEGFPLTLVNPK